MLAASPRWLMAAMTLFLAVFAVSAFAARPATSARRADPPLLVEDLGNGTVALSGPWQFHTGDNMAWAGPGFDDSQWEQLSAATTWGNQGHFRYTGFAWYRRTIDVTPAPGASGKLALLIPPIDDAYELYWNGALVKTYGKLPPHPEWYCEPVAQIISLGPARSGVLAVRVWKSPGGSFATGKEGGFSDTPYLGSPQAIRALKDASDYQWLRSQQLNFGLNSLYALVALLGLIAWLRDRSQRLLFWMAMFNASGVLLTILSGLRIPFHFSVGEGLEQPVFGLAAISLWFVLVLLLDLDANPALMRIVRVLAVVEMTTCSLDGALILFLAPFVPGTTAFVQWTDGILTAVYIPLQALPLILVAYAVLRPRRLAPERWLVALCAFVADLIPTVRTAAAQGSRFTHWTFSEKLGAPLFILNGNPVSPQMLAAILLLLSIVYAVYRSSTEERNRRTLLEQEFQNARELQQVLIPESLPAIPGYALASAYKPALEVGGDFFQIVPLEDGAADAGSTLVVLGDVSGKGLKAAMAVSLIVGAIRTLAEISSSPAHLLAGLNRRLHGRLQGGFATAIALRLDAHGRCTLSTAGHPAPFLNGQEIALPPSLPLGLLSQVDYEEAALALNANDHLTLYTDGLPEARGSGELFGFERLRQISGNSAQAIAEAAQAFGQEDDITVLTLTRMAADEESVAMCAAEALRPA
ncbi:MAG TPA: SpoIIE family protein phosphatase [Terracidiphilus sp.]|nr:SpoIIE family protein phosphatase [Terracidiphilus sp.]